METPPEDHSFTPANHSLISLYLRRRLAGQPLPPAAAAHFHDADIYAAEPAALTVGLQPVPARKAEGRSWFFFTPLRTKSGTDRRRSRRVGGGAGTWHSEHAPEAVVDDDGDRVGHRQLFSFKGKDGKRSGWSMWEFEALDQGGGGGESVLVLCKIHQAQCSSASSRTARKRKATDERVAQPSAPARRRLFASPDPTPPAVLSQSKIGAPSEEAVLSSSTEPEASKDEPRNVLSFWSDPMPEVSQGKIGAPSEEAILSSSTEPEASKDEPKNALSFWSDPQPELSQGKIGAPSEEAILSFSTEPEASKDEPRNILSFWSDPAPEESHGKISAPSEARPTARTQAEASTDMPRSVLSFWNEPDPLRDKISASFAALPSVSLKPDASQQNFSTSMEPPASFLIPEPEASQGQITTFDGAFLMASGSTPAPEYSYQANFFVDGGSDVSAMPLGAEISGSWRGNALTGGFPTYSNAFGFPTYDQCSIAGSAGLQYCNAPFLLSAAPAWYGGPDFLTC